MRQPSARHRAVLKDHITYLKEHFDECGWALNYSFYFSALVRELVGYNVSTVFDEELKKAGLAFEVRSAITDDGQHLVSNLMIVKPKKQKKKGTKRVKRK